MDNKKYSIILNKEEIEILINCIRGSIKIADICIGHTNDISEMKLNRFKLIHRLDDLMEKMNDLEHIEEAE